MSWLFSQALVEEYLAANSLDGEQSAPLNGNPIQQAYCAPDKMKVFSRLSQYGMMFKPLTEIRGEELSMSSVVAFHVRTLARQAKAQELMESDQECGEKWRASFVKYDHDSSSWRTHQCSLLGDLELFSETWPQWGLMRDGECWEQRMLEQTIRGTESGLSEKWATPTTTDKLPPKSSQALHKEATQARPGRSKPANLRDQVSNMQNWPTPCATDYKGSGKTGALRDRLDYAVERGATKSNNYTWPTPRTKGMCGGTGSWDLLNKNTTVEEARLMGAGNGGKLNPMWVEWLMGWPLGWTDLKPLEMGKSHSVPQQLGES